MRERMTVLSISLPCLFLASSVFATSSVYEITETMDAASLLEQFNERHLANPEHEEAAYDLAMLHCFIYAFNRTRFAIRRSYKADVPPSLVEAIPIPVRSAATRLAVSPERLGHLVASIELLQQISTGRLLYGYACREAAARCEEAGWPVGHFAFPAESFESESAHWESEALEAFRSVRAARKPVQTNTHFALDYELPVLYESLYIYRILSEETALHVELREEYLAVTREAQEAIKLIYAPVEGSFEPTEPNRVPAAAMEQAEKLYPPVGPDKNAASYYLHAMDAYTPFNFPTGVSIPFTESRTGEPGEFDALSDETLRVMEEYIDTNGETLRLLHEAIGQQHFSFPVNFITGLGLSYPGLATMRKLGELLSVQAVLSCHRRDATRATSAIAALHSCANSLRGQTDLTSVLARAGLISEASEVTQWAMERLDLSEEALRSLQDSFANADVQGALEPVMAGERWAASLPIPTADVRNEVLRRKIKDINDPNNANITVSDEELALAENRLRVEWDQFQKPRLAMAKKYTELLKLPLPELYEHVRSHGEQRSFSPIPPVAMGHDPFGLAALAYIRSIAESRVAQVALAAARHRLRNGALPRELDVLVPSYLPRDALVDPFNGDGLRFEMWDGGFVVYSEGYPSLNERAQRMDGSAPSGISFRVVY